MVKSASENFLSKVREIWQEGSLQWKWESFLSFHLSTPDGPAWLRPSPLHHNWKEFQRSSWYPYNKLQVMLSGALLSMCCTWCKISPSYFGALKVTRNSMWIRPSFLETVTDSPPPKILELQIIMNTIKQSKANIEMYAEIKQILCSSGLMKNVCCFCSHAFIWSVTQAFLWWKIWADWLIKNYYSLPIFFYKYLLKVRVHFYLKSVSKKKFMLELLL